jgi:hypothetical protein
MTTQIYRTELGDFNGVTEVYLSDALEDDEEFLVGLRTNDRILRANSRLALTSDRVLIIKSGFLDTRGQTIPLSKVESITIDEPESGLPSLLIRTATGTERYTVATPPTKFVEAVRTQRGKQRVGSLSVSHSFDWTADPDERANTAVKAARDARQRGDITEAKNLFAIAETEYEHAAETSTDESTDRAMTVETVRDRKESLTEIEAHRSEIESALSNAEQSFRTAVAAHCRNERTHPRVRYRQARDSAEMALERIDESPPETLVGGLALSVDADTALSETLSELVSGQNALQETLEDHGIETISALQSAQTETLTQIHHRHDSHPELTGRLLLVAWSTDADEATGVDRSAVDLRRVLATVGYNLCK